MRWIIRNYFGIFLLIFYFLLSTIIFWKLPSTFFQQDEWAIFGIHLYGDKVGLSLFQRLFLFEQYIHLIPLSMLFSYLQFKFFGLNFFLYAIFDIIFHTVNALAVFYLAFLLTKERKVSFIAGALFLANSITHQATTWVATTVGTEGSTFFILLSIIFFILYSQKRRYCHSFISVFFLCISLLFKETGIFIFLFLPVLWLLYAKNKNYKSFIKDFSPFFLLGIGYVLFRIYFLVFGYISTSSPDITSQPDLSVYLYRLTTYPLKFIAQSFIPISYVIQFAESIILLAYPNFVNEKIPNIHVVQTIGSDLVSYIISIIILLTCLVMIKYLKQKKEKGSKLIILCISFIFLSSLPFILIPGKAGYFSLIDGRHLYLTSIFSSIFLSVIIFTPMNFFKKNKIIFFITAVVIFKIVVFNASQIKTDILKQVDYANVRKSILEKIINTYPSLSSRAIIYAESDKAYYGLPLDQQILPFQSGFGETLLVWYDQHGGNFPACFFQAKFLYDITSEGYKECNGRGFGYFRKIESLRRSMKENNISINSVLGFRYSYSGTLISPIDMKKELKEF